MNQLELSAVLFYADFLSLEATSTPVTDSCKYFYIQDVPVNICIIAGNMPEYDINNEYFQRAYQEYLIIRDKFGDEGIRSFLDNICNLKATGSVSGLLMLKYLHRFDTKKERNRAFEIYRLSKKNHTYTHIIQEADGPKIEECSKYVAHAELNNRTSK